jgi:hypothetical protein
MPAGFPPPHAVKDIDVLAVAGSRWWPLAQPVIEELERCGVRCATAPAGAHGHVIEMLGRARVLVHPSRVEGLSRLGREARAMGAVPVTLDSNPFAVGLDAAGGAVAVGTTAEMPAAVIALLGDPERLARLSQAAIGSARREVDWDSYVGRLDAAIAAAGGDDPARAARGVIGAALHEREQAARAETEEAHGRATQLERALEAARAESERRAQWLTAISESLSWRLTAPLRWLSRRLRPPRSRH